MSVLYIALPVALIISLIAAITFVFQVRSGQFDDLDTPPRRMLFDDVESSEVNDRAEPNDALGQTDSEDNEV